MQKNRAPLWVACRHEVRQRADMDGENMRRRSQACADLGDRLLADARQSVGPLLERYAVAVVVYERETHGACALSALLNGEQEADKLCQVLDGCLQLFAGTLDAPHSKVDVREVPSEPVDGN